MPRKIQLPPIDYVLEKDDDFPKVQIVNFTDEPNYWERESWVFDFQGIFAGGDRGFFSWRICSCDRSDENKAIRLLRLRAGQAGMIRIRLYHIRKPPTKADIEFIKQFNEQLARQKHGCEGRTSRDSDAIDR